MTSVLSGVERIRVNNREITQIDFEGETVWEKSEPVIDEYTVLLLHGEDFTDSSQTNLQLTPESGVSISNNGHFEKCIYFESTDDSMDYNLALHAPNNSAFNFGTGDFTIDFWMKCNTPWTDHYYWSSGIIGQKEGDWTDGWVIYQDGGYWEYLNFRGAQQNNFPSNATPTTGVWEHWAVVRHNGTLMWFKNGVITNTDTNEENLYDDGGTFYIGYSQTWSGCLPDTYLDEIRISNIARWTSNFTPPTQPY